MKYPVAESVIAVALLTFNLSPAAPAFAQARPNNAPPARATHSGSVHALFQTSRRSKAALSKM